MLSFGMVLRIALLSFLGHVAVVQKADAGCTTETFDFDDGAEGWSKYGYASVSFGGAAYISGDPGGCFPRTVTKK